MNRIVVIVAGGKGVRMGVPVPKQFLELNGLPVLMHTLTNFHKFDPEISIRLVLPATQFEFWEELCIKHKFTIPIQLFPGGENRFQSVKNGITNLPKNSIVGIHDGVRPLVNHTTIKKCFNAAEKTGAVIPVVFPVESLRYIEEENSTPVDRSKYVLIQTPQVFQSSILTKAYDTPFQEWFTDDASVVEYAGYNIELIEGNRENIKITAPIDIKIAEAIIS